MIISLVDTVREKASQRGEEPRRTARRDGGARNPEEEPAVPAAAGEGILQAGPDLYRLRRLLVARLQAVSRGIPRRERVAAQRRFVEQWRELARTRRLALAERMLAEWPEAGTARAASRQGADESPAGRAQVESRSTDPTRKREEALGSSRRGALGSGAVPSRAGEEKPAALVESGWQGDLFLSPVRRSA